MYIKQHINVYQFRDMFRDAGRSDNFSYEGLGILFEYLEDYSEYMGGPWRLDIEVLCCEYNEMSWREAVDNYGIDLSECEGDEESCINAVHEYLQDNTIVCGEFYDGEGREFPKGTTFVFQAF
jgi:hypothetical protein